MNSAVTASLTQPNVLSLCPLSHLPNSIKAWELFQAEVRKGPVYNVGNRGLDVKHTSTVITGPMISGLPLVTQDLITAWQKDFSIPVKY